ncbi:MAG: hypothetical protein KAW16_07945 [candidate division Zixibacteria bacterium]|nr:hypothetical protein [candidate division Zixibacteria bacterium]
MKDDQDKEFVLSLLRDGGFQVQPIPKSTHRTPDLRVMMPDGDVLVEVKSKNDDQQLRNLLESPKGTPLSYKVSTIETCISDAWRHQIRDFPNRDEANFTLVWFITRKVGGITVLTNSVSMGLLYGTELLEGFKVDRKEFYQKGCFFFRESIFFNKKKCKDLDGVVLHDVQSIKLCLNPFSPHYSSFKHTMLTDLFRVQFAVVDPVEMEAANECFIADCTVDRKDTNGIVRYLKSKYGLDTVKIIRFVPFNCPVD